MKKEPVFVTVSEYRAIVAPDKAKSVIRRYRMKFTGKNYIPQDFIPEDEANQLNLPPLGRIGVEELMQVKKTIMGDRPDLCIRAIYFLEGDEQRARFLVDLDMDEAQFAMFAKCQNSFNNWKAYREETKTS